MITYLSTKGGIAPADFATAVMQGYAPDGGLFVPDRIPRICAATLEKWARLDYVDLAREILARYIDPAVIPAGKLTQLLQQSFAGFSHPQIMPVVPLDAAQQLYVLELYHGPTLSFKDVAMGFLVSTLDYLLRERRQRASLLVATTGDTGPAAAHAAMGKDRIDCWVLFPNGLISPQQRRQMTTLAAPNVHAVGVDNCRDGGDDLDLVVANLFADEEFKQQVHLSSVNSINWGRVLMQTVHYFYSYFQVAREPEEKVAFAVPTGAFGNLFSGSLAQAMGLPVEALIIANNRNAVIHNTLTSGTFARRDLTPTLSSAIDIVVPYNFWRYLYFAGGRDSRRLSRWMADFHQHGRIAFDQETLAALRQGVITAVVDDARTLQTMTDCYHRHHTLLDPHGAVAVAGAQNARQHLAPNTKIVCLATAHPAKFPEVVAQALDRPRDSLPSPATHPTIEAAARQLEYLRQGDYEYLETALRTAMAAVAANRGPS